MVCCVWCVGVLQVDQTLAAPAQPPLEKGAVIAQTVSDVYPPFMTLIFRLSE